MKYTFFHFHWEIKCKESRVNLEDLSVACCILFNNEKEKYVVLLLSLHLCLSIILPFRRLFIVTFISLFHCLKTRPVVMWPDVCFIAPWIYLFSNASSQTNNSDYGSEDVTCYWVPIHGQIGVFNVQQVYIWHITTLFMVCLLIRRSQSKFQIFYMWYAPWHFRMGIKVQILNAIILNFKDISKTTYIFKKKLWWHYYSVIVSFRITLFYSVTVVIFAGGKFCKNVYKTFHVVVIFTIIVTPISFILIHKGIWVLFSRGGNFPREDKSAKNAKIIPTWKISKFTVFH